MHFVRGPTLQQCNRRRVSFLGDERFGQPIEGGDRFRIRLVGSIEFFDGRFHLV